MSPLRHLAGRAAVIVATLAMMLADRLLDRPRTPQHITVKPANRNCVSCKGSAVPGVFWPIDVNGDTSQAWLERCDTCRRFTNDIQAASEIIRKGLSNELGISRPAGSPHDFVFVTPLGVKNKNRKEI